MKILKLLILMFLAVNVYGANTATETEKNIVVNGLTDGTVKEVVVTIDTVDTDLTLIDPAAGYSVGLLGAACVESSAANITFKSGTTTKLVAEFGANSGLFKGVSSEVLPLGDVGEDLIIQSSVALPKCVFYLVEYKKLVIK